MSQKWHKSLSLTLIKFFRILPIYDQIGGRMAKPKNQKKQTFTFKYIIPDDLRDYHIDGAHGGVTPRNEISMHLFSERLPIPLSITHTINKDDTLSKDRKFNYGADAIRLVQSSVVMDVFTAKSIRTWLDDRIKFIEKTEGKKESEKKE